MIAITRNYPIGDFGNYYYGSKLFIEGKFNISHYKSISYFNQQIAEYGETNFFENYTPIPPISLLFYLPLTFISCLKAKFLFNSLSLLVFCVSLYRFLQRLEIDKWQLYLLPFIFLYPLYNSIYQGQTYLLITACLMEAYLASEKYQYWRVALLLSLCISLKIFPVFILIYFIVKKEYRIVIYTLLLIVLLFIVTLLIVGADITGYYFIMVLPRLFNNDIVGAYYHGNQSVYCALLNLFSFDAINNKTPIVHLPWLVPIIEGIILSFILSVLIAFRKKSSLLFFGFTLLSSILISRYNTTYSMLILIPFIIVLINNNKANNAHFILLIIFGIAISMPVGYFLSAPTMLRFSRLIGLLLVFIYMIILYKPNLNMKHFLVISILMIGFKYATFSIKPIQYFEIQNTKGILYDYEIQKDSITLISTLGDRNLKETTAITGRVADQSTDLKIESNIVYYQNRVISNSSDNKIKPFLYNDSMIVFMSDLNQAIAVYKLRAINIHK